MSLSRHSRDKNIRFEDVSSPASKHPRKCACESGQTYDAPHTHLRAARVRYTRGTRTPAQSMATNPPKRAFSAQEPTSPPPRGVDASISPAEVEVEARPPAVTAARAHTRPGLPAPPLRGAPRRVPSTSNTLTEMNRGTHARRSGTPHPACRVFGGCCFKLEQRG